MREIAIEMTVIPAQSLRDFALKALAVREQKNSDWFDEADELDAGERLCRALVVELMAVSGVDPFLIPDFEPRDVFPDYEGQPNWGVRKYAEKPGA